MREFSLITLAFLMIIGCSPSRTVRAEEVVVREVNERTIIVENTMDGKTTIKFPAGISKLITVGNKYFVKFEISGKDEKEVTLIEIDPG